MEKAETIYVNTVTVTDPDTGNEIEVEIYKDAASGAMVGIDASFIEGDMGPVYSPYNKDQELIIEDPDDEDES